MDRLLGARGPNPNRVSDEVEAGILAHALDHPTHGALRVAQELTLGRTGLLGRSPRRVVPSQAFDQTGAPAEA